MDAAAVTAITRIRARHDRRLLPPPAPLDMPIRQLNEVPHAGRRPVSPVAIGLRRALVLGGAVLLTGFATHEMSLVLGGHGSTALQAIMLLLFVLLFGWISLAFMSAVAGFAVLMARHHSFTSHRQTAPLSERTALLMPIHNEDVAAVFGRLEAMVESLVGTRQDGTFDLFVLSDTTDSETWIAEQTALRALRARVAARTRLFYLRRPDNGGRKAGNVANWVRRFGAAYAHFVVLDADSVMDGRCLVALVTEIERRPDAGLIQTYPLTVGGHTLLARMQQFAGRVYGPVIAEGIAWWHGPEGNFWGHNAIIRTQAFAEAAGLPRLSGYGPFGGDILSHDFVEAALLRRHGWGVLMLPALAGSYEQGPPTMIELAARDRRWCQGNVQHAAVLPARGLHWMSRLHLLQGIGAYATAPLWLAFLALGGAISVQAHLSLPRYFPDGPSLFPNWPEVDPVRAMWMFAATMLLLLAPKLLGVISLLADRAARRASGGGARVIAGALLETLLAGLLAPVTMLSQARQVVEILLGRDAGWSAQARDCARVRWRLALRRYWTHTAIGLVAAGSASLSPALALWMAPILLGLVMAIPLVVLTGNPAIGTATRRLGLLLTPEEASPPRVLRRAMMLRDHYARDGTVDEAVGMLAADPHLLAMHRRLLPPRSETRAGKEHVALSNGLAKARGATTLQHALDLVTPHEKRVLLGDPAGLARLVTLARRTATPTRMLEDVAG